MRGLLLRALPDAERRGEPLAAIARHRAAVEAQVRRLPLRAALRPRIGALRQHAAAS